MAGGFRSRLELGIPVVPISISMPDLNPHTHAQGGKAMRILLIEDETALGAVIRRGLEADRHQVEWAQDGNAGLKQALENEYDLILLDLMLPGRDGWSICEELRARRRRTLILMLTAREHVDDRVRGLEMGADDYLTKPF